MTDEAYDLRSNIKAKPGSQGTLFQVKDKGLLNPQQRWPQGYTPERLQEVRHGLRTTPVDVPEHLYDAPDREVQEQHGVNAFGYRDRLARTIAKSTVPAEHLEGLKGIHGQPEEGDHGTYWMGSKTIGIDLTRGRDMDRTLIHEIGHHADNVHTNRTDEILPKVAEAHAWKDKSRFHDAPTGSGHLVAKQKVEAGVGEAVADDYMTEHYRTGGRKSKGTDKGQYERNFTSDRLDSHYPGYTDVRPHDPKSSPSYRALQAKQFEAAQGRLF